MIIYLFLFIYFFINIIKNKKSRVDFIFLQIILIFLLSFTYKMGSDWIPYQRFYNNIDNINIFEYKSFEIGYTLYCFFMKKIFGFNYEIFMGITIGTCIYILLKELKKRTNNYFLATFIFTVQYLFNTSVEPVVRQLIALTILVYALKYIEEKKLYKFILFVVLASQFHMSAIIFLAIYGLEKVNIKKRTIIILFFVSIFLVENIDKIINLLSVIIPFFKKFEVYLISERYGEQKVSIFNILYKLLFSGGCLYLIFYSYDYYKDKKNYIKNSAIIYCLLMNLQYKMAILYRIQDYLVFFFAIAISTKESIRFINNKKIKNARIFITLFLFIFYSYSFFKTLTGTELNRYRYYYRNYFFEMIKGNIPNNFIEKSFIYEKEIKKIIEKDTLERNKK